MKQIFTILFILIFTALSLHSQSGWIWQNPKPQGNGLNDVFMLDNNRIIAVGEYSTILTSKDGGSSWSNYNYTSTSTSDNNPFMKIYKALDGNLWLIGGSIGANNVAGSPLIVRMNSQTLETYNISSLPSSIGAVFDIQFVNDTLVYAITSDNVQWWEKSALIMSIDGGNHWTLRSNPDSSRQLYCLHFIDGNNGFVAGISGTIHKTSDGGLTWTDVTSGIAETFSKAYFLNSLTGWMCGNAGIIIKTTDGGNNWTKDTVKSGLSLQSVLFLDEQVGYTVGNKGNIYGTEDGGITWVKLDSVITANIKGIHFNNYSNGFVVGDSGNIYKTVNDGSNWTNISLGTRSDLKEIHFSDKNNGWTCGTFGTILNTTDGGTNWVTKHISSSSENLYSMKFIDAMNGWAVGDSATNKGLALKTTDGGNNWQQVTIDSIFPMKKIFVLNNKIWCVGTTGRVLLSTDAGNTWKLVHSPVARTINDVYFTDDQYGFAVGASTAAAGGLYIMTNDGGLTWTHKDSLAFADFNAVYFLNSQRGWIIGNKIQILRTTDGGQNWSSLGSSVSNNVHSLMFLDGNNGFSVGDNGTILQIFNGGTYSVPFFAPTLKNIYGIFMLDSATGWVCGDGGLILKTENGGNIVGVGDDNFTYDNSNNYFKIYPNPASNKISITFKLSQDSYVGIKLMDYLGNNIESLTNKTFMSAGFHTLDFDVTNINPSLLFCILQIGERNYLQKIVIDK